MFRHSCSHLLAMAVLQLYPDAKLAIGPAIENGFYYDFDIDPPIKPEDLPAIEKAMDKIMRSSLRPKRFTLSRAEAIELMKSINAPYKVELIQDLPEDATLSFYQMGDFVDLCAGPHLPNLNYLKAFKLTHTAGAYWRGDEHKKMLCRVYGTCFPTKAELGEYLMMLEEAKKRDHRRLGRELDLFDLRGRGPRLPLLLTPRAWLPAQHLGGLLARDSPQSRIRGNQNADDAQPRACGSAAATGTNTAKTCIPPESTIRTSPSSP